jgi:hypothetical protein
MCTRTLLLVHAVLQQLQITMCSCCGHVSLKHWCCRALVVDRLIVILLWPPILCHGEESHEIESVVAHGYRMSPKDLQDARQPGHNTCRSPRTGSQDKHRTNGQPISKHFQLPNPI